MQLRDSTSVYVFARRVREASFVLRYIYSMRRRVGAPNNPGSTVPDRNNESSRTYSRIGTPRKIRAGRTKRVVRDARFRSIPFLFFFLPPFVTFARTRGRRADHGEFISYVDRVDARPISPDKLRRFAARRVEKHTRARNFLIPFTRCSNLHD